MSSPSPKLSKLCLPYGMTLNVNLITLMLPSYSTSTSSSASTSIKNINIHSKPVLGSSPPDPSVDPSSIAPSSPPLAVSPSKRLLVRQPKLAQVHLPNAILVHPLLLSFILMTFLSVLILFLALVDLEPSLSYFHSL